MGFGGFGFDWGLIGLNWIGLGGFGGGVWVRLGLGELN